MLAYRFAEALNIKHKFDNETKMAGEQWFKSFMERNPELTIRQSEGLSMARAKGLKREEVKKFFDLLTKILKNNDLWDKPERLYNMDETGIQLNNKAGKVVAEKGKRNINSVTSAEKGETLTVVACCNAVGNYLPPVVIIKGVNKKPEFEEGLPEGSQVYMSKKSAYINTELFYKWLTEHFIPNKPNGKVLLILDGHSSHSSAPDMLQKAADNDVILLCLPGHTTSALQPLDRAVFKPFKQRFNDETNLYIRSNPTSKISRYNIGPLIRNAWVKGCTASNAISGFRGTGIFPKNMDALPSDTFLISDASTILPQTSQSLDVQPETVIAELNNDDGETAESVQRRTQTLEQSTMASFNFDYLEDQNTTPPNLIPVPVDEVSPSLLINPEHLEDLLEIGDDTFNDLLNEVIETPSKFLHQASPIPQIPITIAKRAKQSADILNSTENIKLKKEIVERKQSKILSKSNKEKKIKTAKGKGELKKTNNKTKDKRVNKYANQRNQENEPNSSEDQNNDCIEFSKKLKKTSKNAKDKNSKQRSKKIFNYSSDETTVQDGNDEWKSHKENINTSAGARKRFRIYSSNSEDEENPSNDDYETKGKKTKGLLAKKLKTSKRNEGEDPQDTVKDFCIECFENYQITKSTSDWIQCIMCQKWLHETCTLFKNYCSRCGKLKTVSGV